MEHRTFEQLQRLGTVAAGYPIMSRDERLERWAVLLDHVSDNRLSTLRETEYQTETTRNSMRADNTPISTAFSDPILRAAGLESDTYGAAKRFFEISDSQLHDAICYCHFGATVTGAEAAYNVRAALAPSRMNLIARLRAVFSGW